MFLIWAAIKDSKISKYNIIEFVDIYNVWIPIESEIYPNISQIHTLWGGDPLCEVDKYVAMDTYRMGILYRLRDVCEADEHIATACKPQQSHEANQFVSCNNSTHVAKRQLKIMHEI